MNRETLQNYTAYLIAQEQSAATVEKYVRSAGRFLAWLGPRKLDREAVVGYKAALNGSASTVNGAISALNSLLAFLGRGEWKLRHVKAQRRIYRPEERELTRAEFERLVRTAERQGNVRLARAIEAIAATGIRVSELRFFTCEAVAAGEAVVTNKGKSRTVLLPKELQKKLAAYCRARGITAGEVFVSRSGKPLARTQLWAEMKALCRAAHVEPGKVFPHNLRHLFAVIHYRLHKDVVKLADLLGHSSVNTTRIYLMETGREHRRQLERMHLVL